MWRSPKVYADSLARVQGDDAVVVRAIRRNYFTGEKVVPEVLFSHYGAVPAWPAEIRWVLEGTTARGKSALPDFKRGRVDSIGTLEFVARATQMPAPFRLKVDILAGGKVLAANELSLFFYPQRKLERPTAVVMHDPASKLASLEKEIQARGYVRSLPGEPPGVLIASEYDERVKRALAEGRKVILLPSEKMTLAPGLEVVPRAGSVLDGNWISGFLWTRHTSEPFRSVAFGPLVGFEAQAAAPRFVVQGIPAKNFGDVLAGMFFGWLHANVGVVVQARVGKGRLIVCTMNVGETYGSDPYATHLLDALVHYAAADFHPAFEIPF
jgi:hypothetical protein